MRLRTQEQQQHVGRPNRRSLLFTWALFLLLCAALNPSVILAETPTATPAADSSPSKYQSDYNTIKALGKDLYEALKPNYREQVSPNPIWFIDDPRPYVRPFVFENDNNPLHIVYVSKGFIQLVNSIAHAKAIDKIEPGFFNKYIQTLAQETSGQVVPELPKISDPRYWTDDVLNEQLSSFNQIVGSVAAINLAHHYLGHQDAYGELLHDSVTSPVTMATSCSQGEWDQAFKEGAGNSLDCGFGFEGLKAFYDCIVAMEKRPSWTLYFLPTKARLDNLAKTKKTLDHIETVFFGKKL
ncbi:MAG: hypothetical protein JWM68_743 [Verrucomicrobiales bacterium]|nr:hypothetical protein [Verrucomicrobiales bacterium]